MANRYTPIMEPYKGKIPKAEVVIAFDAQGKKVSLSSYIFEGYLNTDGKTFRTEITATNLIEATKQCITLTEGEQNKLGIDYLSKPQHNGECLIEYCILPSGSTLGSGTMKDLVNGLLTIESLKDL